MDWVEQHWAYTQGKKLRMLNVMVAGPGPGSVQRYGGAADSSAAWRLQATDQGMVARLGRKFPALDRQMSSRITAPAHTVGAVVSSHVQRGLVRVGMDSWRG